MGKKDKYIGNEILNNNDKNVEQQINRRDSWEESHTLGKTKTKVTLILAQQFFFKKINLLKGVDFISLVLESSGLVQHRKSAIHGLPVKSGKSDWLRIRNEYSTHTQKIGSRDLRSQSFHRPEGTWVLGTVVTCVRKLGCFYVFGL